MIHLGSLCPGYFHPAGCSVPQSRPTPQGPGAHPKENLGYESRPPPLPFKQVGILGWSSQGPSTSKQAGSSTRPPCPALQVPPGVNSFRISVLEGSIPKTDTQHDCHALPGLDLTTQCGGARSWDAGAQHNHKAACRLGHGTSRPCTPTVGSAS